MSGLLRAFQALRLPDLRLLLVPAVLLLATAEMSSAQRTEGPAACPANARAMTRLELIFGMSRKNGRGISDPEWRAFLADEVTPRFPDGLTVLPGYGQWRRPDGRITREPMRLLLVVFEPAADSDARIEAIREAWKRRFQQDSVLRADSPVCVSF